MPSLKELYFHSVCILSRTFTNFIPNRPLLVLLTLINRDNLKESTVPYLNYLEKIQVNTRKKITKIVVKAQNFLVNFASTNLQLLHIDCTYVPYSFSHDICSTFPFLKSLCLVLCRGLKKKQDCESSIGVLTLNNIIDLREAFIAIPNLYKFNVIYSIKFKTPRPIMGSRQIEIEYNLLELRTFAENLDLENLTQLE